MSKMVFDDDLYVKKGLFLKATCMGVECSKCPNFDRGKRLCKHPNHPKGSLLKQK